MTNTPNNPVAMEATVAAEATPTGAAAGAAGDARDPGSSPGMIQPVPSSPGDAKRGRQGDHDPGKPLFAFAAIHARQDTTDDDVTKLKTEIIQLRAIVEQVVKEVKGNDVSKLTEDLRACFGAIEANDMAQKEALKVFEAEYVATKNNLAKMQLEVDLYKVGTGPAPSAAAATLAPPPGVELDGKRDFVPYVQLMRDELKVAVAQLQAVDEAQEQDILKLTAGSSDNIGQLAASAAHVAQHIAWVTSALATAEGQLVAISATLSSTAACP